MLSTAENINKNVVSQNNFFCFFCSVSYFLCVVIFMQFCGFSYKKFCVVCSWCIMLWLFEWHDFDTLIFPYSMGFYVFGMIHMYICFTSRIPRIYSFLSTWRIIYYHTITIIDTIHFFHFICENLNKLKKLSGPHFPFYDR